MSSQSSGRQRINMEEYSAEEEALSIISEAADIRLAAKKAFRAEAKEIRSKEIEKQQKESESESDEIYSDSTRDAAVEVQQTSRGSHSSAEHVSTECNDLDAKDTDYQTKLRELEKKHKAAMVNSAQLDNENQSLVYELELLKDQMEEHDEEHTVLQRNYKEKCREYDFQKRDLKSMEQELNILKQHLEVTTKLLAENGFIILVNDKGEPVLEKSSQINLNASNSVFPGNAFLVSTESHNTLKKTGETTPGAAVAAVKKSADSNQVSSSGDEVDGSTFAKVSDYSEAGADRVILHDSSESVTHEHEVVNIVPLQGIDGDRISSDHKSLVSQNVIVSECQETGNSSLTVENSEAAQEVSYSTSACLGAVPDSVSVDDDVDEFFDAVSTPSPSTKTGSYDEQGVYDQNVLISAIEGSSVDPEIRIKECENSSTHTSAESERQSILLENVTETESSTDIIDESEEQDIKEIITEAECGIDTTDQNKDSLKEVIEEKGQQSVVLETSENGLTEVGNISNEESAGAESVVEEPIPENQLVEEENSLENDESCEIEHINKDSQEVLFDIPQDVQPGETAVSQEVEDVQNKLDITQPLSCEVPYSTSLADVNLEINVTHLSEEALLADNQDEDQNVAEGKGDTGSVEITDILSTGGTTDVRDTQDVVEEAAVTESIVHEGPDISSVSGTEALEVSCPTEILPEDASEKQDSENMTEKEEDEAEQLSNITLNLGTQNKEEGDNIEENNCEEDAGSPVRDASKLVVRTTSIGGSEASEGAVIDDYDLDDIDDVLNINAPAAPSAELNATPSGEAELSVLAVTESHDQENKSNAKSPSKIDMEEEESTKAKSSKKNKSEKSKSSKKRNADKAEKIKSGEKESKDKAEKVKSKEKTEKSKSSKKAEKSKTKKEADSKAEAVSSEEDKHSIAESQTSLEPDDLEGALDKQMLESEKLKSPKKSSKKLSIFKKVFK